VALCDLAIDEDLLLFKLKDDLLIIPSRDILHYSIINKKENFGILLIINQNSFAEENMLLIPIRTGHSFKSSSIEKIESKMKQCNIQSIIADENQIINKLWEKFS
jgi:hypothetical protein